MAVIFVLNQRGLCVRRQHEQERGCFPLSLLSRRTQRSSSYYYNHRLV